MYICIHYLQITDFNDKEKVLVPVSCIPTNNNIITLNNIPIGHYYGILFYRQLAYPHTIFLNNDIINTNHIDINIFSIYNNMPKLLINTPLIENGVTFSDDVVNVDIVFTLMDINYINKDIVPLMNMCINWFSIDLSIYENNNLFSNMYNNKYSENYDVYISKFMMDYSMSQHPTMSYCMPANIYNNEYKISLSNINKGFYIFQIDIKYNNVIFDTSREFGTVEIQTFKEFYPSYDWQLLHAWNTIPSGLETRYPYLVYNTLEYSIFCFLYTHCKYVNTCNFYRLPLSSLGGHKEARIPQPWRLQLSMPPPCKYFLRMNMFQHTTVQDIK